VTAPLPLITQTPAEGRPPQTGGATTTAREHIRGLDGVRGLAIVMVMVGHFWLGARPRNGLESGLFTFLQNGWIGVDLFFVLSGFLITGILLDAKGSESYFRNFYARRFLRIFPLYYGFLIAFFIIAPMLVHADANGPFAVARGSQIWFWTYTVNYLSLVKGAHIPEGLNHFWTLAVEEQFYLIWPAVVFFASRGTLKRICLGLVAAALAFRIGLRFTDYYHTGGLVLTPARIDTLAIGAWLAAMVREEGGREWLERRASSAFLSAALLLVLVNLPDERLFGYELAMQTVGFPLLAVMSAALIVMTTSAANHSGLLSRTFDSRPLGFFGRYSYGMYVLHLPLVVLLARVGFGIQALPHVGGSDVPAAIAYTLAALSMTTVLAYASWHLFEKHFLALKRYFPLSSKPTAPLTPLKDVDDSRSSDRLRAGGTEIELEAITPAGNQG
jgi:peptidoglycan/LPS O-acetylase OafA/YrhL